jgi:hypothetical protein
MRRDSKGNYGRMRAGAVAGRGILVALLAAAVAYAALNG